MKNWKTTIAGCLTAGIYAAAALLQQGNMDWKDIAVTAGLAAVGVLAKDMNVTGGSVTQK
jgi:hypothetical protein